MRIIVLCRDAIGQVAFPAETIDGILTHERRYAITNHVVVLDSHAGLSEAVIHHDVAVLLGMPNGFYRLPTPDEQNAMVEEERRAAIVEETVPLAVVKSSSAKRRR